MPSHLLFHWSMALTSAGLGLLLLSLMEPRRRLARRINRIAPTAQIDPSQLKPGRTLPRLLRPSEEDMPVITWLARHYRVTQDTIMLTMAMIRVLMPLLCGMFLALVTWPLVQARHAGLAGLAVSVSIGMGLGIYAANRMVHGQELRRRQALAHDLPNAMDLLLICLGSGVGLQTAIERTADELRVVSPDVAGELLAVNADLAVLGDYDRAFEKLAERIPVANIASLITIIRDSLKHGSPIRAALQSAMDMERQRSLIVIDQLANEVPAKITTLTMCFCFPPLLVVIGAPPMLGMASIITH